MSFTFPTIANFKAHFFRDFPYADDQNDMEKVTDKDIEKAMLEARQNFNAALFADQDGYTLAALYLTAHYLVMDLRAAAQGVSGKYTWLSTSRSVGNVSESYAIPESVTKDPALSYYAGTYYGTKYLSIISPLLIGNIRAFQGTTWP